MATQVVEGVGLSRGVRTPTAGTLGRGGISSAGLMEVVAPALKSYAARNGMSDLGLANLLRLAPCELRSLGARRWPRTHGEIRWLAAVYRIDEARLSEVLQVSA
ncbi:MAG: hypothetical protein HY329_17375 [Chloroflexi bacterium]|nr:hypothetical protein [Chloroflexota bacterium]